MFLKVFFLKKTGIQTKLLERDNHSLIKLLKLLKINIAGGKIPEELTALLLIDSINNYIKLAPYIDKI